MHVADAQAVIAEREGSKQQVTRVVLRGGTMWQFERCHFADLPVAEGERRLTHLEVGLAVGRPPDKFVVEYIGKLPRLVGGGLCGFGALLQQDEVGSSGGKLRGQRGAAGLPE